MHLVIVFEKFIHGAIDCLELLLQFFIYFITHPCEQAVDVASTLYFYTLRAITKIAVAVFFLKLLTPFSENSQNSRTFDGNISTLYLDLREYRCVLWYFSSNQIMSIFFDLIFVFLFILCVFAMSLFVLIHLLPILSV